MTTPNSTSPLDSNPSPPDTIAVPFSRAELEGTLGARFDRVVAELPDRLAIDGCDERLTFAHLDRRVNQLARLLFAQTPAAAGCVAILVDHSPAMIIAVLAVLKAGKAYLCLHPRQPEASLRELLDDAKPEVIVADDSHAADARRLAGDDIGVVVMADAEITSGDPTPQRPIVASDAAAIIYTSGTTGRPKGIVKSHRMVLHRAWLAAQYDGVCPADRQSLLTYCSFASSETDVFGSLLNGASVHLFDPAARGLDALGAWIDEHRITLLHPPVVLFRRYLAALEGVDVHPSVRLVALAGETVIESDLASWRKHFNARCEMRHRFSSTEAGHIAVAMWRAGGNESADRTSVRPVTDKLLSMIDSEGMPTAAGATGELVVRSAYLASGYWRRPEESVKAFPPDPTDSGLTVFRTGDLGRVTADGAFEFLGRRDHQVKIRGYRVEILEVENILRQLPGVKEAAVVAERLDAECRLIGFVVAQKADVTPENLAAEMRSVAPDWKVPSRFHLVETLPLTLTGKIDRQTLERMARSADFAQVPVIAIPPIDVSHANATVVRMTTIWAELLGKPRVAPDDNFFDLGGHSLLAMQMIAQVGRQFGRSLPLSVLATRPTARLLAELLASTDEPAAATPAFLQLRGLGRETPLYFLPRSDSNALTYAPLARLLTCDRPLISVLDPIHKSDAPLDKSTEEIAARFVDLLCSHQPTGAFALAGHSHGGVLAYEVARQLHDRNRTVEVLALLDARVPGARRFIPTPLTLAQRLRKSVSKSPIVAMFRRARRGEQLAPSDVEPDGDTVSARSKALNILMRAYRPPKYSGAITLFRALVPSENPRFEPPGPLNGWDAVCDDVEVIHIPGDHHSILREPNLSALAAAMNARLARS